MYSWRQRPDTTVVDEPLYAHYLHTTGRVHPGRGEVLASQENDGEAVLRDVMLGPVETPVVFFKQMAKHMVGLDRSFLDGFRNILLTREPLDMLTSWQVQVPDATLDDTGFVEMLELLDLIIDGGEEPIVIDSRVLLANPPAVLTELCERLGLAFDPAMLSWPAGPKPEDGVWAPYWYDAVRASTGWAPWKPKDATLLPHLEPVLEQAQAMYTKLAPYSVTGT